MAKEFIFLLFLRLATSQNLASVSQFHNEKDQPKMFVNFCCNHGFFQDEDHQNCNGAYQPNEDGKDWKPKALS